MTEQVVASEVAGSFRAIRRRWWLVALCWVLVVGAAAAFSFTAQKQYSASAELFFRDPGLDQKLFGTTFLPPSRDPAREAATNVKLVSLDVVADRTARSFPGLTGTEISRQVEVAAEGQSDVVSVTATNGSPAVARRLANTFAGEYIAFRREADRGKVREALVLLSERLAALAPAQRAGEEGRSLSQRADQLRILSSLQTGNAELVQLARTPVSASSPDVTRNLLLAGVLGLALGLGSALALHRLDRRVREPEELEAAFGLPVLGAIPRSQAFEAAKAPATADTVDLPHAEAEAFRLLRARMRYFNVDKEVRSVLVTSAAPADGKTTVAVNLAAAAAGSGARILLLEADMRRPTISERLSSHPAAGLAELLSHGAELEESVRSIGVRTGAAGPDSALAHFDLISSGFPPPNPHELIESRGMSDLLHRLESTYDLVIIDTPPLLSVSDAIPLIRRVGGVIIVSRLGSTTRDAARRMVAELEGLEAPVLGVVANGVRSRTQAYYYGVEPRARRAGGQDQDPRAAGVPAGSLERV